MRIACVQNGDYTAAYNTLRAGGSETYNGQRYTVNTFDRFARLGDSVVISLDAPTHEECDESQIRLSFGPTRRLKFLPQRWTLRALARRMIVRLERLQTTHLLIRCVDVIGCELLQWACEHRISTAVIIAARFDREYATARRFCSLANGDHVVLVANHNRVATQSMIECGLNPAKAIAWDLPPALRPTDHAPRTRRPAQRLKILTAGSVEAAKGIGDLVKACDRSRATGTDVHLTICGDGPLHAELRRHAGVAQGWLECLGRVSHNQVVRRMLDADVVAVPSRTEFPEGLPFVIQEALAVRAPLVLSDHPVFVRYFRDGHGVRFFRQTDLSTLSTLLTELAADPDQYAVLSNDTADAWNSLACPMQFHHLLDRLKVEWRLSGTQQSSVDEMRIPPEVAVSAVL